MRGFSSYFLQEQGVIGGIGLGSTSILGLIQIGPLLWTSEEHLAMFVGMGVIISIIGIKIAPRIREIQMNTK